ncbi:MAG: 50S ribosomal protein L18e [Thermoprotei archaeon]|nr:MAG: 50S ribosomal protein L18e [Thermoprotei archaeon]RLE89235.1 MAG: 50S ribosomal protein L18e [Thermoprotei archaeon]
MRRTGPTDIHVRLLASYLRKCYRRYGAKIWRYVAELIMKPRRSRIAVNISKINRYTDEGDQVVVPGKVLASGELDHKVVIAALAFSERAREKIKKVGGEAITIPELIERNPKGSNVKVII